jgi:hypothetical protein
MRSYNFLRLIYNKVTSNSCNYFLKFLHIYNLRIWFFQLCQKLQSLVKNTQGILGVNIICPFNLLLLWGVKTLLRCLPMRAIPLLKSLHNTMVWFGCCNIICVMYSWISTVSDLFFILEGMYRFIMIYNYKDWLVMHTSSRYGNI